MICKNCGNEIDINDKFCGVCGAQVEIATMLVEDDLPVQENPYAAPDAPVNEQPAEPVIRPVVMADEQPVQPVQQPVQQYAPVQPVQQPVQPVQQYAPVQQPVQPVQQYAPVQQYGQPVQQYGQPMQQYGQPAQQYVQPAPQTYGNPDDPAARSLAGRTLAFGITSLSVSAFAFFFYCFTIGVSVLFGSFVYLIIGMLFSAAGIVFGALARGSSTQYSRIASVAGRARVGRILGTVGFILGIVFTSIIFITMLLFFAYLL